MNKKIRIQENKAITLIALVITIIVLIILAGIAISMMIGDNGIFAKAKEAKRLQITAEAKEKIGADILAAQVEAIERNEELEQAQVEDIISKYGILQDDKDTIVLKDNGYEISLLDIYQGTTTSSGSYTENKAKIELLEGQVKRLQEQLDSMSQTGDEKDKKIAELNDKVTNIENEKNELQNENNNLTSKATELTNLKKTLGKVTVTEGQILKDYTAYKEGKLITGTMTNYAGTTQNATSTSDDTYTYLSIPNAGYYGTDSKLKILNSNLGGVYYLGIGTSFNIKTLFPNNYTTLTTNNFIVNPSSGASFKDVSVGDLRDVTTTINYSASYDASSGIFNCSGNIEHNILYSSGGIVNYGNLPLAVYLSLSPIKYAVP